MILSRFEGLISGDTFFSAALRFHGVLTLYPITGEELSFTAEGSGFELCSDSAIGADTVKLCVLIKIIKE